MSTPPPLPSRTSKPPRTVLVAIWVIAAVGAVVIGWQTTTQIKQQVTQTQRTIKEKMILNNLRLLGAAADQYFLENRVRTVKLRQIVGPDKYVKVLMPVDGEDYGKLDLTQGVTPWKIVTASGITVTYKR